MKNAKRVIRLCLLIGGIFSLYIVLFMFAVASSHIGFYLQLIISILMVLYAIFLDKVPKKINVGIIVIFLCVFSFALFLSIYGNRHNVDYTEDVVIVLGAGVLGENVTRPLAHRLNAAAQYWWNNPDSVIVVTGGLGSHATITEAEAMSRFLIRQGIPEEVIILEDNSTSTYENLTFTKEILEYYFPDGFSAVLVTNDFHIFRAVRTARSVDIDVHPIGAYTDWYTWPVNYLRETLAVINFMIFD